MIIMAAAYSQKIFLKKKQQNKKEFMTKWLDFKKWKKEKIWKNVYTAGKNFYLQNSQHTLKYAKIKIFKA